MKSRWVIIGVVVTWLAAAAPLQAQQESTPDNGDTATIEQHGFRVAEASNGFQLVEHGIWAHAAVAASSGALFHEAERPDPRAKNPRNSDRGSSSFRRASYLPHVYAAEAQFSLPAGLLDALVWTESRYNPLAISKAGAAGLGQLMPGTARDLGVSNRFEPIANIFGAAKYLRQMLDKFGEVRLALAAYNAGPGAVERTDGIPRNGETTSYVREVLRRWHSQF